MNDETRKVLSNLKDLMETRKRMQAEGLLTKQELGEKLAVEEKMKLAITEMIRKADRQKIQKELVEERKKAEEEKKREEKAIGQMAYRLERRIREAKRLKEEEDYRMMVEQRYQERMRKERGEEEEKEEEGKEKEEEQEDNGLKIQTLTI